MTPLSYSRYYFRSSDSVLLLSLLLREVYAWFPAFRSMNMSVYPYYSILAI